MADKPDNIFTLTVNGEKKDYKMSFALLQELMKFIPEPAEVASLLVTDFYLREYVVRRVLTGNKRVKSDEDLVDLFEMEVEAEDLDDLVLWVVDHILYFFTSTAKKSLQLGQKYQEEVKQLTQSLPSPTGSQD